MSILQEMIKLIPRDRLSEKQTPPLKFAATGDCEMDKDGVWILVMANHPDDDYYDDYHGTNVIFKKNGKISGVTGDKKSQAEWRAHKAEIIAAAKKLLDKDAELKKHLGK